MEHNPEITVIPYGHHRIADDRPEHKGTTCSWNRSEPRSL
jgi:hypothetical protein